MKISILVFTLSLLVFAVFGFAFKTEGGLNGQNPRPHSIADEDTLNTREQKDEVRPVITSSSCLGDVTFAHSMHFNDLEIECTECHHETNASELKLPHEKYFEDFWIQCAVCHRESGETILEAQTCSKCHHSYQTDIADETLSAKVVIHTNCWKCHEVGTGQEASQSCSFCHTDPKTDCW